MSLKHALEKAVGVSNKTVNVKVNEEAPEHLQLGVKGENLASEYLLRKNYTIIARNVRYRFGEIDIIAKDKDEIVFVEVRTRSIGYIMPADRTVGPDKLSKLTKAANIWVENNNYNGFWRIDLVAITIDQYGKEEIEHIKDITEGIA